VLQQIKIEETKNQTCYDIRIAFLGSSYLICSAFTHVVEERGGGDVKIPCY